MMRAVLRGTSVIGPGLNGWPHAKTVLAGDAPWLPAETLTAVPEILEARERRRTSPTMRLALNAATEACAAAGLAPTEPAGVFVSAAGDGSVVANILASLATAEKLVSPTVFHNSVHNAPAGYWSIGGGGRGASTSLAAGDWGFGAGLLKALVQVQAEGRPVLLVVFDTPMPPPFDAYRPREHAFAVGLLLAPDGDGPVLTAKAAGGGAEPDVPVIEALRPLAADNPAGHAVPLLEVLARGQGGAVTVAAGARFALRVFVAP